MYGMAGRSTPNREVSDPKVEIRCGARPTVIPAGTSIAFAVQKCRRVPTCTRDTDLDYNMEETPENISVVETAQEAETIVAVPSREMQADCELEAGILLEGTTRRAMRSHRRQGATIPRPDGCSREKTYKVATSDESARQAMGNTKLIEHWEKLGTTRWN